MTTTKFETLDKVDLVSIDCTIWTGEKQLYSGDIDLGAGGKLPSKEVAKLGMKRTVDPKELRPLKNARERAARACLAVGTRFLGGYVIPRGKTAELAKVLDEATEAFAEEKRKFLKRYDQIVESWLAQHTDFERQLREAIVPRERVEEQLTFEYSVCRIEASAATTGHLANQVDRLGSQLLHEVAIEAGNSYERSFTGNAGLERKASRKTLGTIWKFREKLAGLAFLDESVEPMVKAIDALFAAVPKTGPIEGALYDQALALVLILSDPDKVRRHADVGLDASGLAPSVMDEEADPEAEAAVERAKSHPAPEQQQGSLYF